jgi:hypothetical protein
MDNLSNFGLKDDEIRSSRKSKGGKAKPWKIESRMQHSVASGLARTLGFRDWWTSGRYTTRARRDQALAALVKKEDSYIQTWPGFPRFEYRAVDP